MSSIRGFAGTAVEWLLAHPWIVIGAFLVYVVFFILSVLFSKPKPGKNPFGFDAAKAPKPLVTDHAIRDRVLKQGFHQKRIPERVDAIVIGSGIGGLSVASILAKTGKSVLVLEQHDQAGGCCHTFIDKGYEFDVGIHYIGEMRNNTVSRLLVSQLTEGQLRWCDLIDEFDVVAIGDPGKQKMYPFRAGGFEKWKGGMMEHFPNEEKALDKYIFYLKEVRKNMLGQMQLKGMPKWLTKILVATGLVHKMTDYFKYSSRTLQSVLDEITDNKDLKAVLAYSFGDYGTEPSKGSFAMHAALINHYMYGASYPRGGASEIAFHIIPTIEKAGGRVLVRAPVKQILCEDGKAVGVRVEKSSGDIDLFAPMIISDAGAINTFKTLLPPEVADKSGFSRMIKTKKVQSGIGAMSIFVGLRGSAEELGIKPQNIWAFTGNDLGKITRDFLTKDAEDAIDSDIPLLFISFPSAKDETYEERFPGKTVCTIVTLANWSWFSDFEEAKLKKRGDDYDKVKNAIGQSVWEQTCSIFPQLADKVEYFDVGSPVTNKHYLRAPKGEIYGLDHDAKRFGSPEVIMETRPTTDIPGLYMTGQDVLSGGFMGAMFGGILCGSQILNRNLYEDLMNLRKKIKKGE